jgi:N-acetylneuraminate lyase
LNAVEKQAERLLHDRVSAAFICGSTGESHSLTTEERLSLAQRWSGVIRGTDLRLVVHVGSNCLSDAKTLATHAESVGAHAIAALAPSYFKPKSIASLVECCKEIAAAASRTPFYYYDIPSMTGVSLSVPEFLEAAADAVPTIAGVKFSNPDLMAYQRCVQLHNGRFDMPWGTDECLLAALAVGAVGAVGSSYNFAANIYHEVISALGEGDLPRARQAQFRSVQLIELLAGFGYMAASKAVMGMLGIDVGPPRLPHEKLSAKRTEDLRSRLERLGFFDRGKR